MKRFLAILAIFAAVSTASAQSFSIKNNLLGDATASINLGAEVGFAKKYSMELYASYNPFKFSDTSYFKHLLLQPEFRYWTCESFNGLFFGVHGLGAKYAVMGVPIPFHPEVKNNLYQGWLYGAGVTVGYQWIIHKRWNIEAALGGGYVWLDYDKYDADCVFVKSDKTSGFTLTRATVAFVFFFN